MIDITASVDNEHYCLALLGAFGMPFASTEIATFGKHRVLVVERFDRQWLSEGRPLRVPQEVAARHSVCRRGNIKVKAALKRPT